MFRQHRREKAEAAAPNALARVATDPVSRRKLMALTGIA